MKNKKEIRQFRPSRWWANVTALRVDGGISEKELSELVGKKETYIRLAVKHGGSPNIADALAIAEAFGKSVEELAFDAIGLEIRRRQLEEELARIQEEIQDAQNDFSRMGE